MTDPTRSLERAVDVLTASRMARLVKRWHGPVASLTRQVWERRCRDQARKDVEALARAGLL